jgi:hypothetical protein
VRAWLLLLLLLFTLVVEVWPAALPWRAWTLHHDLPWAGLALAVGWLALALARRRMSARGLRPVIRAVGVRRRLGLGLAATAVLVALVALPSVFAGSRLGLTARTGARWGALDGTAEGGLVRRLDLGPTSGGPWARESFFADVSGWLYAPVAGRYQLYVDVDRDAMVDVDGVAVVGQGAPDGQAPPGVTDAGSRYRRGPVYLRAGYHELRIRSRHEAGSARLRVRWTLPWMSRAVTIPAEHLAPAGAAPRELAVRQAAMVGRRIGVLGLAVVALGALARVLRAISERRLGWTPVRVDGAGAAGFALLFLVLTGAPLLLWPEQHATIAPLLLVASVPGALTAGAASALGARWREGRPASRRHGGWARAVARAGPPLLLLGVQAALLARFLAFVDGRLPLPGDHSSFLYRYHSLLHTLPRLRGYDPWWNAGVVDPSAMLSGATATLALFWPLLLVWRLPDVYAAIVALVGIAVVPWSSFATVRVLGGSRLAALLAGLLALAPSDVYFWWLMGHGTLPALVSAALAPLVIALAWRVFVRHDHRWPVVLLLAASLLVGVLWVLLALMVIPPLLFGAVVHRRHLRRRDWILAGVLGTGLLLVHAHWLIGLFGTHIAYVAPAGAQKLTLRRFVEDSLQPILHDPSPAALMLGVAATLLLPRPLRAAYGGLVLWLLACATLLRPAFLRLELDRFFVPFALALIPPAAWMAARLVRTLRGGLSTKLAPVVGAGLLAVLALHVDGVWRQYSGQIRRTARQIDFLSDPTREVVDWIRSSAAPDARVLLLGDLPGPDRLEGGYKAYLQPLTGRPLIGIHQNVKVVDLDVMRLLREPDLRRTLETLNVRHVLVGDSAPRALARVVAAPGLHLRRQLSRFTVYDADIKPTYVEGAAGAVAFDYDRLDVRLEESVERVTLKFRWAPGLVADPPLPLEPVQVLPDVRFIGVRTGGVRAFRIRYVDCCPWHPVEMWARWRGPRS